MFSLFKVSSLLCTFLIPITPNRSLRLLQLLQQSISLMKRGLWETLACGRVVLSLTQNNNRNYVRMAFVATLFFLLHFFQPFNRRARAAAHLVRRREPESSVWASSRAVPCWPAGVRWARSTIITAASAASAAVLSLSTVMPCRPP